MSFPEEKEIPISALRGRGTSTRPTNRFEKCSAHTDWENWEELPPPHTQVFPDLTKTILAKNDSPDIPFTYSINPYRGCEHGCVYCYARPTHEFLGLSAGLDFETKIFAKYSAAEKLRRELGAPSYSPEGICLSGVTDPYQPLERNLKLTRACLEVLLECRNPVSVITKNHLVVRDADLLAGLAADQAASVYLSVTTLDAELARKLEPRASAPNSRLRAIAALTKAGIPVGVMVAPVIPGLTDHEIPSLLTAAREAGARTAGLVLLRLPFAVASLFETWLGQHYPERKDKVLGRLRDMRKGKLNDPNFGSRMTGEGPYAEQIKSMFRVWTRKLKYEGRLPAPSIANFVRPVSPGDQLELF